MVVILCRTMTQWTPLYLLIQLILLVSFYMVAGYNLRIHQLTDHSTVRSLLRKAQCSNTALRAIPYNPTDPPRVKIISQKYEPVDDDDEEEQGFELDEKEVASFGSHICSSSIAHKKFQESIERKYVGPYVTRAEEIAAYNALGLGRNANFYMDTLPKYEDLRDDALLAGDTKKVALLDKHFNNLMRAGFTKRLQERNIGQETLISKLTSKKPETVISPPDLLGHRSLLTEVAGYVSATSQAGTAESFAKELALREKKRKGGLVAILPDPAAKVVEYLQYLWKPPTPKELRNSLVFALAFVAVIGGGFVNKRSLPLFYIFHQLASWQNLLRRNMPEKKVPGVDMSRSYNPPFVSIYSFWTAVSITFLGAAPSYSVSKFLFSSSKVLQPAAHRLALSVSILATAYLNCHFEVFEKKGEVGSRWREATSGKPSEEVMKYFTERLTLSDERLLQSYDYEEPENKADEGQLEEEPELTDYQKKWRKHYEEWVEEKRKKGKDHFESVSEIAPYLQLKNPEKFFENYQDPPEWIQDLRMQVRAKFYPEWRFNPGEENVRKPDALQPKKFLGPLGFRDTTPDWFKKLDQKVFKEDDSLSRSERRKYGAYRKAMYRLDSGIQLSPYDGVSVPEKSSVSDEEEEGDEGLGLSSEE